MLNTTDDKPADYSDEYIYQQFQEQFQQLPEYYLSLSDIELGYFLAVIKIKDFRPAIRTLKLPVNLYSYIPDKRTITIQHIGKPSSGPSPPLQIYFPGMC